MTDLVLLMLIFIATGAGFLSLNMFVGKLIRPNRPSEEKGTIYECGEPSIGSSWIQFDLRFYVVALLFVIFDVEMAFFFPWAAVFGNANRLAHEDLPLAQRIEVQNELLPGQPTNDINPVEQAHAARSLAWIALIDMVVFLGILLVGFAYLWKRGDLDWVRSMAAHAELPMNNQPISVVNTVPLSSIVPQL